MSLSALGALLVTLALAPALPGIVQRTKAVLTGRRGAPLLQLYFDLWKLARKGTVMSRSSSPLLPMLPAAVLASTVAAALLVPIAPGTGLLSFPGDFLAFLGLLGLARYALVLAAAESGSSFEGMGASREAMIGAFAEPALLLCVACLALVSGASALSGLFGPSLAAHWSAHVPAILLIAGALFLILLAETAQVPVDDPATHLELTMIHEVMVLDLGGPDLAFVLYAAALKLTLLAALVASLLVPVRSWTGAWWMPIGTMLVAVVVGLVGGLTARLRLDRLPQFVTAAMVLASLAIALTLR
jgi:formate hydrogenlyase subunit 4